MNDAVKSFEKYFLQEKIYPEMFDRMEVRVDQAEKIFDTKFFIPLSGHDSEGRKIVIIKMGRINMDQFTMHDFIKGAILGCVYLQEEEETQIGGIAVISDCHGLQSKHIMNLTDIRDFSSFVKNNSVARVKGHFFVNLPTFAVIAADLFKMLVSEKLKMRFFVCKDYEELRKHIEPSMLPSEYGGQKSESEMFEEFKDFVNKKRHLVEQTFAFKADWSKVPMEKFKRDENDNDEQIESFRNLEID